MKAALPESLVSCLPLIGTEAVSVDEAQHNVGPSILCYPKANVRQVLVSRYRPTTWEAVAGNSRMEVNILRVRFITHFSHSFASAVAADGLGLLRNKSVVSTAAKLLDIATTTQHCLNYATVQVAFDASHANECLTKACAVKDAIVPTE